MLNNLQQKELHNALMSAFPNRDVLERMLSFELSKNLEEIAGRNNLSDTVFILIKLALAQGWLEDLVSAAHDSNPRNPLLLDFFKRLYLKSDLKLDYTQLRDLLKAGDWKQADKETLAVMLKATGKTELKDSLTFDNFPCVDLHTIDHLWVKFSNGHFGFSVQKRIWKSVDRDYGKFGDRVGWRKGMFKWISYSEVIFDSSAPEGHLPCLVDHGELKEVGIMFNAIHVVYELYKIYEIFKKTNTSKKDVSVPIEDTSKKDGDSPKSFREMLVMARKEWESKYWHMMLLNTLDL